MPSSSPFAPGVAVLEYEVGGNTCAEVANMLADARANVPELKGYEANTEGRMDLRSDDTGQFLVRFDLDIVVRLPRLAKGTPQAVRACFVQYRRILVAHEQQHVDIRKAAIGRIRLLAQTPPVPFAVAEKIARDVWIADDELDERTDHGGPLCRFPPPHCPHLTRG